MLGAEMWTCLSGILPGWIFLFILVFCVYTLRFGTVGCNSSTGFRLIYDEVYRSVFPKIPWLRNNFTGSILRIHDGDHCMCSHSYGFYEYFVYRDARHVRRKDRGGCSLADFFKHPINRYDLVIMDFPLTFGRDFLLKLGHYSERFILRVNSTIAPAGDCGRYMTHGGNHYYVSSVITDDQFYGYFSDRHPCGKPGVYCSSPSEDLLSYLDGKKVKCVQAYGDFARSCAVYFDDCKIFCFNRSVDMIFSILNIIDYVTYVDKKFDTQVMFEILLMKKFIDSGDKSYHREKQLARLIRKIVVVNRHRRVKATITKIKKMYYSRDAVVATSIPLPVLALAQSFHDFNHGACQDYYEILSR